MLQLCFSVLPLAPPRGWERNAVPTPQRPPRTVSLSNFNNLPAHLKTYNTTMLMISVIGKISACCIILSVELIICAVFSQAAPVQWCGPDGSVVLIRAVRSGLDRVVLELLRAGVPVNNTDHTGKSAINPLHVDRVLQSMWSSRIHYRNSFCFLCSWGVMFFALSGFVFVTVSVLSSTPHCRPPSPPASLTSLQRP